MSRLLYEKSVSYKGNLIIPFLFTITVGELIYSYCLLSEDGDKSPFHKATNPSELYSNNFKDIIDIAKQHLDKNIEKFSNTDYFKERYTYQNNLIIIHQEGGKCFYDHYPPHELKNIAAPKIFLSAYDCLTWVKKGLNQNLNIN
ncbi:hypothetical protein [Gloeothece verrucosa]|nr:hypothetical protein [Gloeothece verrucosa]